MRFPNLFSPININGVVSKNRIVAPPTGDFFEDKALGGAGIVIAGHAIVEPGRSSFASPDEPDAFSKYEAEATRRRILKIHQAGARASIEIFHGGLHARVKDFARGPVSFVREDGTEVRGMTRSDMDEVLEHWARTAWNAKDLGFDMLFLHFGHGWLPAQFLSPRNNTRTDEYGGSIENRARFPLEILKAVREAVGPGFPIDMRISAFEWMDNSIEFEDVLQFIKWAEKYIDAVQISAGVDIGIEGNVHLATTNFSQRMPNAHWAAEVKKHVNIKVGVVGAILNPDDAEELIASGAADLVALGRALIADPNWPRKAQEGREDEIVPCIRCLQCYHISTNRRHVGCSVNPRFWNEEFIPRTPSPTSAKKRLVVVGGGPAGIVGAMTAADRGHEVILLEKSNDLGGQLRWIAKEHYKEDIADYFAYLLRAIDRSTVDVRLGVDATPQLVSELEPDALMLAIGATELVPPIPGLDLPHVYLANESVVDDVELGDRVVVIGAGQIGTEMALELAELEKKNVVVVDLADKFAGKGNALYREGLRQKLAATPNLSFHFNSVCKEITPAGVQIKAPEEDVFLDSDNVILAVGMRPLRNEAQGFYGITPETVMVGDCVTPRIIQDAVYEAYSYAINL
ncbi:MAG: FAD-dependent oxidoreductase [Flaviflexus sp.]|uniref:oxidoreductase n=1 Tax=Flaviflexus sp. TaxID=1969482 RepID=UPI00352C854A